MSSLNLTSTPIPISTYSTAKPLFKYIGGKSWLKEELQKQTHKALSANPLDSYCEPFCGGLGAFLNIYDVLLSKGVTSIQLNDISTPLIALYNSIYTNRTSLLDYYENLETSFNALVPIVKPLPANLKIELEPANEFFKEQKKSFNILKLSSSNDALLGATLMFLQKHSFNGVYRENLKGEYNTPYNWDWKKVDIDSAKARVEEIYKVFNLFKTVSFTNLSYDALPYNSDTFYYLDPPYLNDSIGENKYSKDSFGKAQQKSLIDKIKNVKFLYSNHNSQFLIDEFVRQVPQHSITIIKRKNIMSAKSSTRSDDKEEILVSN